MRFYTKEWYELMQHQDDLSGMQKIPDGNYSEQDIQAFYQQDLEEEVAQERERYNTPPTWDWQEELLDPECFSPENFLFEDEATGKLFHPQTPGMARAYLEADFRRALETFERRPPFDAQETISCFQECYRSKLRYAWKYFPQWVQESVDKRLLALDRIPASAYDRLQKEAEAKRQAFEERNAQAEAELSAQDIPPELREAFCFHDAQVLKLRRRCHRAVLLLCKDGYWDEPYTTITFEGVRWLEREPGLVLRCRPGGDGLLVSNCQYLYDELYRTREGYEVHMLLWTSKALRYFTVCCENVRIDHSVLSPEL